MDGVLVTGKQLAQLEPGDTNAASLYSPDADVTAELSVLVVAETAGGGAQFRVFHDDNGTTYSTATALFYDVDIAANTTYVIAFEPPIWMADATGNLAVRTDTATAVTFTLYGKEHVD